MERQKYQEVERCINQIRPYLRAEGGDLTLVDILDDGTVKIRLRGACRGCPYAYATIKNTIESYLRKTLPFVKRVISV